VPHGPTPTAYYRVRMPREMTRRLLTVAAVTAVTAIAFWWLLRWQYLFDLKIYIAAEKWWLGGHDLYDYAQPDELQGKLSFTYPPFAALLFVPLGLLPAGVGYVLMTLGTLAAVALTTWWVTARFPIHWYAFSLALPLVLLIEPIRSTLSFGQINMLLVALILADVLVGVPQARKWAGVGIGLAAAIKLTPALFIVYLFLSRRTRAALTALGTATGATLLAALITPNATRDYWLSALWDTSRVGRTDYTANQSINGMLSRLFSPDKPPTSLWVGLALALAVVGLWRATVAARAGDDLTGIALTGLTAGLISPITWVHHLYWFVPALIALVLAVRVAPSPRRTWLMASAAAAYLICVAGVDTLRDWGVAQRPTPSLSEFLLRNAFVLLAVALVLFLPVPRASRPVRDEPDTPKATVIEVTPVRPPA
jgi:alpha-1,2-mannosyltransferase